MSERTRVPPCCDLHERDWWRKMLCDAVEVKLKSTLALRRRAEEMAGAPGPKSDDQAAGGEVHHAFLFLPPQ